MGCTLCLACPQPRAATSPGPACALVMACPHTKGQCQEGTLIIADQTHVQAEHLYTAKVPTPPSPVGSKPFAEFPLVESLRAAQRINRRSMNDAHDPFISRLPPELASQIFTYFLPIDVDDSYSIYCPTGPRRIPITPLRLGSVCQSWREIAWAVPALWSSISVDMYAAREKTAELVQEWLGRSGQLPLYIRLYAGIDQGAMEYYPNLSSHYDPSVQRIFDIVNAYSHRWKFVDLELPESFLNHLHSSPAIYAQPMMVETLRLNVLTSEVLEPPPERAAKRIDLNGTLSPAKLLIRGLHLEQVGIQWHSLTHVEAFDFSVAECLDLLQKAPLLINLTLKKLNALHAPEPRTGFLYHHALKYLSLKAIHQHAVGALNALFDRTSFPGLTYLAFDQVHMFVSSEASIQPMLIHFSRSASRLLALEIKLSTTQIAYDKVADLLHTLPTVESLALEFGRYKSIPCLDPILEFLVPGGRRNGKTLLPRLTSLIINNTTFSWDRLFQLFSPKIISSPSPVCCPETKAGRADGRNGLSSLRVVLPWAKPGFLEANVTQEVLYLTKRGINVHIVDEDGHDLIENTVV